MDTVIGILICLFGLYLMGLGAWFGAAWRLSSARSEAVELKVIALHRRESHHENSVYSPEFQVIGGHHDGKTNVSQQGEERAMHAVGDLMAGRIDPRTGNIWSDEETPLYQWMPIWAALIGAGLVAYAVFGYL
jgi:hypothetical protein